MVPELSRSADHLCQQKINEEADEDGDYFKGNLLKTPDCTPRGITPSASMIASPGVSQWTVNESTTQTEGFWHDRGDSFDSSKSYSLRSGGNSMNHLNKHHRSRSVPSVRCAICKQSHHKMKPSESMHYARTVSFQGKKIHFCHLKTFHINCFQNRRKKFVARCQISVTTALALDAMLADKQHFIACTSQADRQKVYLKRLTSSYVIIKMKRRAVIFKRKNQIDDVLKLTFNEVS